MNTVDECRRALAGHVRENSSMVDQYLDTARKHAGLLADLAEAACRERWPEKVRETSILARIRLSETPPEKLLQTLDAAKSHPGIDVHTVVVCRESMSILILGRKTP